MSKQRGICVIMIEQSAAMTTPISFADDAGPRSKPLNDLVSTALNTAIRRASESLNVDTAIFSHQQDGESAAMLIDRHGETRDAILVEPLDQLVESPLRVETRTVSSPTGTSEIQFPIFYEARPNGDSAQNFGWQKCLELLRERGDEPVLILNITRTPAADGNPRRVIEDILNLDRETPAILFQIHMGSSERAQSNLYSANSQTLPSPKARELHSRSSRLPQVAKPALQARQQYVTDNSRLFLYNAKLVDLANALRLMIPIVESWPVATEPPTFALAEAEIDVAAPTDESDSDMPNEQSETPFGLTGEEAETIIEAVNADSSDAEASGDQPHEIADVPKSEPDAITPSTPSQVICVLGRGVTDPFEADGGRVFRRLQNRLNELLKKLADDDRVGSKSIGLIAYGTDFEGQPEAVFGFEADTQERFTVPRSELSGQALRIIESEVEIPNGVGGLMKIPKTEAIFVEQECSSRGGLSAVVEKLSQEGIFEYPTMLLHFVAGEITSEDHEVLESFLDQLDTASSVFHIVETETAQPACRFPAAGNDFADDSAIGRLCHLSSAVGENRCLCVNTIDGLFEELWS